MRIHCGDSVNKFNQTFEGPGALATGAAAIVAANVEGVLRVTGAGAGLAALCFGSFGAEYLRASLLSALFVILK